MIYIIFLCNFCYDMIYIIIEGWAESKEGAESEGEAECGLERKK